MRTVRYLCLFALLSSATVATAAEPAERFYCNLHAFTPAEREAHHQLTQSLLAAARETVEQDNGFSFRLELKKEPLATVARWVEGEQRCCPFLRFKIDQEPHDGPLWLELSGAPGVKDFLRAELGLGEKKP